MPPPRFVETVARAVPMIRPRASSRELRVMAPLSIAVLVVLGLWPLWAAVRARGLGAWRLPVLALAVTVSVASVWVAFTTPALPAGPPADRPIVAATGDFVTSDTCRGCHPRQHATWRASFHRTMTQPATPDRVIPEIDSIVFEHRGGRVRLEERDGRVFAGAARPTRGGIEWIEREVVQTTGSHHFQVFWFTNGHGRELTMFPFCYRIDEERWMPVDAAFLMPPDTRQPLSGARWNTNCIVCHTTQGQPRVHQQGNVDTHVAEFGIACESCHGPAGAHVAANRDPLRRYALHLGGAGDETIEDPAEMTPEREAQVCGQCHAVTIARSDLHDEWAKDGFTYRPGDDLLASRVLVSPDAADAPELRAQLARQPNLFETLFWPDGQVRISGRDYHGLLASPCYADGDGERKMTCLSCHAMHPAADDPRELAEWAEDQLKPGMRGDLACTQCHQHLATPDAARAHSRHDPDVVGCYDCHMPYTTFGLLKAIRSHTVTSPSVQETVEHGRPNACNLCHLDRSLGWTGEQLARDFGIAAPPLGDDERNVAAGVLWALKGDAGERALVAAAMGRAQARSTAGTDWLAPYLGELLRDPYHAVRFVAQRALREAPSGAGLGYDFLDPEAEREAAIQRMLDDWSVRRGARRDRDLEPLLIDASGDLRVALFRRLLAQRDHRPVYLGE